MKKVIGLLVFFTFFIGGLSAEANQTLIEQMEKVVDDRQLVENELEQIDQQLNQAVEAIQKLETELIDQQSIIHYYSKLLGEMETKLREDKELVFTRIRVLQQIISMSELLNEMTKDIDQMLVNNQDNPAFEGTWPLEKPGRITSLFGKRTDPFTKEEKMHSGMDIAAEEGTGILAIGGGTVQFIGYMKGYGNVVVMDHGKGWSSLYAHIRPGGILVQKGQELHVGHRIAEVGTTGRSTGPHLHVELYHRGTRINPLAHLHTFFAVQPQEKQLE